MGSHNLSRIIAVAVFFIVGIVAAQWSVTDPVMAAGLVLGFLALSLALFLQENVWMLIPFFFPFSGAITALPGSFALKDLVVGYCVPVMLITYVAKRYPLRVKFEALEFALILQFVMVAQALVRNPVGVAALGSDTVGGRKYFEIAVASVSFIILSAQEVEFQRVKRAVYGSIVGGLSIGLYELVVGTFPVIGYKTYRFYRGTGTGSAVRSYFSEIDGHVEGEVGRKMYLMHLAKALYGWLFAFYPPITSLNPLKLWRVMLITTIVVCILLSGFRSGVVGFGLTAVISTLVWRRPKDLFLGGVVAVPILCLLLVLQGSVVQLPHAAQRALSFLPADWDDKAESSAEGSVEWRMEMWKEALFSEKYIQNKIIGDGFGFSAEELNYQASLEEQGYTPETLQDYYLMTGNYHSGPVETIRRVGYLGLFVLLLGMGIFFRKALKLISFARGTKYFCYVLYAGIPFLTLPFIFIFIFGEYQSTVVLMCFMGGMLRLMENSLYKELEEHKVSESGSLVL